MGPNELQDLSRGILWDFLWRGLLQVGGGHGPSAVWEAPLGPLSTCPGPELTAFVTGWLSTDSRDSLCFSPCHLCPFSSALLGNDQNQMRLAHRDTHPGWPLPSAPWTVSPRVGEPLTPGWDVTTHQVFEPPVTLETVSLQLQKHLLFACPFREIPRA